MSRNLLAFASFLATVSAHGHVTNVIVNGVSYPGWDINSYPYMGEPPVVAAWETPNTGGGPVDVSAGYTNPDIICNLNATNAKGYITVAAGDSISLQWTVWPESHHGPVLDYLASCNGDCSSVDKTALEFFKIDGVGLVDNSAVPGTWGDDQLIANDNSWLVQIPNTIAPGNYVLRHELIALHGSFEEGGAQNYPQCFNLEITGSGSDTPAGVVGTELYSATEEGILVDIYKSLDSYVVPGPTLYSGAVEVVQATSAITATGAASTGGGGEGGAAPTGSASATATSSATSTASTTVAPSAPATTSPSRSSTTTVAPPASFSTTTRATPSATSPGSSTLTTTTRPTVAPGTTTPATSSAVPTASNPPSTGTQAIYQQCGGLQWKGATACAAGSVCHNYNPYYSQCIPA
ncbi:glycosyl hydrolase family 61-domain-containing protein [Aspergillus karnatakaensis]|uniref:glycosyl hydrolase family 61-domain-containing protein n=1 Tax=Aspergillus karnatakaensis TaxID=1810916 RepID=UPI003CCDEB5E